MDHWPQVLGNHTNLWGMSSPHLLLTDAYTTVASCLSAVIQVSPFTANFCFTMCSRLAFPCQ